MKDGGASSERIVASFESPLSAPWTLGGRLSEELGPSFQRVPDVILQPSGRRVPAFISLGERKNQVSSGRGDIYTG